MTALESYTYFLQGAVSCPAHRKIIPCITNMSQKPISRAGLWRPTRTESGNERLLHESPPNWKPKHCGIMDLLQISHLWIALTSRWMVLSQSRPCALPQLFYSPYSSNKELKTISVSQSPVLSFLVSVTGSQPCCLLLH